jgi:hypothetical protein
VKVLLAALWLLILAVPAVPAVGQDSRVVMLYANPPPRGPIILESANCPGGFDLTSLQFAGTGVVVADDKMLTVWHVAALENLRVWTGDYVECIQTYRVVRVPNLQPVRVLCGAPIAVLSEPNELRVTTPLSPSFREVPVGEHVTAVGYSNGEWTSLGLRVENYDTISFGGELVRYMILAPADFEYFPPRMGGMSGGPILDKNGRVIGLISLQLRSTLLRSNRIGGVSLRDGLGRCQSRILP